MTKRVLRRQGLRPFLLGVLIGSVVPTPIGLSLYALSPVLTIIAAVLMWPIALVTAIRAGRDAMAWGIAVGLVFGPFILCGACFSFLDGARM